MFGEFVTVCPFAQLHRSHKYILRNGHSRSLLYLAIGLRHRKSPGSVEAGDMSYF